MLVTGIISLHAEESVENGVTISATPESVVLRQSDESQEVVVRIRVCDGSEIVSCTSNGGFTSTELEVDSSLMSYRCLVGIDALNYGCELAHIITVKANKVFDADLPYTIVYKGVEYHRSISISMVGRTENAFVVDADNDTLPIAVDGDGKTIQTSHIVQINAYYGKELIKVSELTYEDISGISKDEVVIGQVQDRLTIIAKGGFPFAQNAKKTVTIKVTHSKYGNRNVNILLIPQKAGKDGMLYSIKPSHSSLSFHRNPNGDLDGFVDLSVEICKHKGDEFKTFGIITEEMGMELSWQIDDGLPVTFPNNNLRRRITASMCKDKRFVYIFLRDKGGNLMDKESLPIVYDGEKGEDGKPGDPGKPGVKGAGPRFSVFSDQNVDYLSGTGDEQFYDIVEYVSGDTELHLLCKKSHKSQPGENPLAEHEGLWEITTMWDLLLAEKIAAKRIDTDGLVVNELQTYVDRNDQNGRYIYISKGLQRMIGGGCEFQFGFDESGKPILAYFSNGVKLYDLGPNGLHNLEQAYFESVRMAFIMAQLPDGDVLPVEAQQALENPKAKIYYKFHEGTGGSEHDGKILTVNQLDGDQPLHPTWTVANGYYTQYFGPPMQTTLSEKPNSPMEKFYGMFTPNQKYKSRTVFRVFQGRVQAASSLTIYW